MKKIFANINFVTGLKFPVGKEKEGIYDYLDNAIFDDYNHITVTIGSTVQLLAVRLYAMKHNYLLSVQTPSGSVVEEKEMYRAHLEVDGEYFELSDELNKKSNMEELKMANDIKQMTVKQLYEETKKLVENGYGDKYIVLSDDAEGNSYHGLYEGFIVDRPSIKRIMDLTDLYDTDIKDINKLVILG